VKIFRVVAALLVLVALAVAASRVSQRTVVGPESTSCTPHSLSGAANGSFHVMSVDNFGCAGDFAFLWATVGTNETDAIGVTEVLRFSPTTERWAFVSRQKYCHPTLLPYEVYRQGCFSN
jgi:hypothetical protein